MVSAAASRLTTESLLALLRRHYKLFAAIFFGIFGLAVIFTFAQTPRYEAVTRILIDPRTQSVTPSPDVLSGLPQKDQSVVDTEVEVLNSFELARRVARELHLANDSEFGNADNDTRRAADAISGNLNIRRVGETYLIDIAFDSASPDKAAQIANAFAINYIGLQTDLKSAANKLATDLLAQRIKSMAQEVKLAELKVQQFKIDNGLMSVNGATLAEQSIASIDNDLARARAEEEEAFGRLSAAQAAGARRWHSRSLPRHSSNMARSIPPIRQPSRALPRSIRRSPPRITAPAPRSPPTRRPISIGSAPRPPPPRRSARRWRQASPPRATRLPPPTGRRSH
jgi:uncharacterized protein involved in exopolysaccharide biosynthesis